MLAMANQNGIVPATAPGISSVAFVSLNETRKAIALLEAPDPDSKSLENEGKRICRVEGGYLILNYDKYRSFNYSMKDEAVYMREYREKKKKESELKTNKSYNVITKKLHSASASASESKSIKIKTKIKNKIEEFKKVWFEQIKFYMIKYPGLDYNLEREKIEAWIDENSRKALKKKNWNLFIHGWLGRSKPQYGFKNQQIQKQVLTEAEKITQIEDQEEQKKKQLKSDIADYESKMDQLDIPTRGKLEIWKKELKELQEG
jgi:hypothetical protein